MKKTFIISLIISTLLLILFANVSAEPLLKPTANLNTNDNLTQSNVIKNTNENLDNDKPKEKSNDTFEVLIKILAIMIAMLTLTVGVFSGITLKIMYELRSEIKADVKEAKENNKEFKEESKNIFDVYKNDLDSKLDVLVQNKFVNLYDREIKDKLDEMLKDNSQVFINKLNDHKKEIIDSNALLVSGLSNVTEDLITELTQNLNKPQQEISEIVRNRLLQMSYIMMLFSDDKKKVTSALYNFAANPTIRVSEQILTYIENKYRQYADILDAIERIRGNADLPTNI
ncbi:hypothetical protein [Candidatus Magnetomonas plexicatena]|uniref:hypothetical protein n=1 Tax=Candidatus Magnetomonas plexicatena TaxID=2552947 RepID=UPI001C78AE76|nr:hypothetical protein E2O03_014935 [Nitrospirales bacterium LBB_01]